jgi:predicted ArsR family transcriptional regulator
MEQGPEDMAHSVEEYLEAIRENEPASTSEIADAVGVTRQGADYRLRKLQEDGVVDAKMVGNSLVWMDANDE